MPISRSQYQDPHYVPVDLIELGEEEDELYYRAQTHKQQRDLRAEIRQYGAYLNLREEHGLNHIRAAYGANFHPLKMPAKSTYKKKAGAVKTRKPYVKKAGGVTKPAAKVDNTKVIAAAVNKALSKNIETQHSYMDIIMFPSGRALTGNIMSPLNSGTTTVTDGNGKQTTVTAFDNNRSMALNLSTMMQVRGGNASAPSGWRTGYKSNVLSIRVDVRGNIKNCATECKFHAVLVRKKDGIRPPYHTPTIINFDESMLWRKNYGGPYAHGFLHYDFPTLDKKNTEVWSWPVGGHVERTVAPIAIEGATRSFQLSMYKEIKDVWEFTSDNARADPSLKDGDYCLFVFREGADDAPGINSSIRVTVDIAFKDT